MISEVHFMFSMKVTKIWRHVQLNLTVTQVETICFPSGVLAHNRTKGKFVLPTNEKIVSQSTLLSIVEIFSEEQKFHFAVMCWNPKRKLNNLDFSRFQINWESSSNFYLNKLAFLRNLLVFDSLTFYRKAWINRENGKYTLLTVLAGREGFSIYNMKTWFLFLKKCPCITYLRVMQEHENENAPSKII